MKLAIQASCRVPMGSARNPITFCQNAIASAIRQVGRAYSGVRHDQCASMPKTYPGGNVSRAAFSRAASTAPLSGCRRAAPGSARDGRPERGNPRRDIEQRHVALEAGRMPLAAIVEDEAERDTITEADLGAAERDLRLRDFRQTGKATAATSWRRRRIFMRTKSSTRMALRASRKPRWRGSDAARYSGMTSTVWRPIWPPDRRETPRIGATSA